MWIGGVEVKAVLFLDVVEVHGDGSWGGRGGGRSPEGIFDL